MSERDSETMIVKNIHPRLAPHDKDSFLTLGNSYVVFSIKFLKDQNIVQYGIDTDNCEGPGLFDAHLFKIVDHRFPPGFTLHQFEFERYRIQPAEFDGDFWDLYHDADEKAEAIYAQVVERIKKFHGIH
jgi:hypothetical protein